MERSGDVAGLAGGEGRQRTSGSGPGGLGDGRGLGRILHPHVPATCIVAGRSCTPVPFPCGIAMFVDADGRIRGMGTAVARGTSGVACSLSAVPQLQSEVRRLRGALEIVSRAFTEVSRRSMVSPEGCARDVSERMATLASQLHTVLLEEDRSRGDARGEVRVDPLGPDTVDRLGGPCVRAEVRPEADEIDPDHTGHLPRR
jgi:hypothetical protein